MIPKTRLDEIKRLLAAAADGSTGIVGLISVVRAVPELLDEVAQLDAAVGAVEFLRGCLRSRMAHARMRRARIVALEQGLRDALEMWLEDVGGCAPGEDVDYDRLRALVTEDEDAGLSAGRSLEQVRQTIANKEDHDLMKHFVSATCEGETCRCGNPATHKVGEEIPPDEPCPECGQSSAIADNRLCLDFYHHSRGPVRHNLTAYVCCSCFTKLLGPATGCPAQ